MENRQLGAGLRILVVEDSPMSFALTSAMIQRLTDLEPDHAKSGEEAIQMLQENEYDIVFMDYFMPGMSGVETTRLIRSHMDIWPQPIIVGLSGAMAPRDIAQCREAGMDYFLAKPLRLAQLESLLSGIFYEEFSALAS